VIDLSRDRSAHPDIYLVRRPLHRLYSVAGGGYRLDLPDEKTQGQGGVNWKNRGDRIGRMQERDQFSRVFMPIAYLLCVGGILLMAWQGINRMEGGHISRDLLILGQLFFLVPVPFWFFRLVRGHYSSRLRD
jgi:hypothetical protein